MRYERGDSFEKVHWRKGLIRHCERIKSHSKLTHYYSNIEFVAFLQQFFLVFLDKFFNLVGKKKTNKIKQKVPEMSVILILSISNGIINPLQPNISRHILQGADKENLFNNQEFLLLVIISLILMTLLCDSGMIL